MAVSKKRWTWSEARRLARMGGRFARDSAYRSRVLNVLQTQAASSTVTTAAPPAAAGWLAGKRIYFIGGCEFTYVKEHLDSLGAVTYHTFDYGRPSDPAVEVGDPASALWGFDADIVVLSQLQTASAWLHRLQWKAFETDRKQQEADLSAIVDGLRGATQQVADKLSVPVFVMSQLSVYRPFYGVLEQRILRDQMSLAEATRRYDLAIYELAREVPDCFVLDVSLLVDGIGADVALAAETELLGEHFTREGAAVVAGGLVRALHALDSRSEKVKCAVLDLDDTLWTGILREDGPSGVVLRHQVLRALKILARRGILLAVCSKNDPAELDHLEELLGSDLFSSIVCTELSWAPKSEGLRRIAQQLNIGLDSLALFDDNVRERAEVSMNAPEVRVYSDGDILRALSLPEFDPGPTLTKESKNRAVSYRAEAARRAAESSNGTSTSPDDFLKSLDLHLRLGVASASDLPRVSELLARTNQLNATVRRTDLATLRQGGDGVEVFVAELDDRFGDYGLIGAAVVHFLGEVAEIVELAFSCRAMGRHVEQSMLSYLLVVGKARGTQSMSVRFQRTDRNAELLRILHESGFEGEHDDEFTMSAKTCEEVSYASWLDIEAAP